MPAHDISRKITTFFADYPQRAMDKRQILARPDEPLTEVFYLVEGRVSQYDITPSGNEVVVNVFKPGAFFPMSTALNHVPNQYFLEASTPVTVRVAPAEAAVQFLKDNPDVLFDLLSRVYRGVDGILHRLVLLMGGDAKSRLVFEIVNAAQRFGESQPNGSVRLKFTEGDLARHSGLARETISRTMQELKAAGLLEITRQGLVIENIERLEAADADSF